jgi:hypothetical protein
LLTDLCLTPAAARAADADGAPPQAAVPGRGGAAGRQRGEHVHHRTGATCPTTGSTAAINCYDNAGGEVQDDSLNAPGDAEPIGGICFKGAQRAVGRMRAIVRRSSSLRVLPA